MVWKLKVRAHFGQSNFPFFQQKRKKEILLILDIFTYFKVQTKIEKKKMVRKIDHFFHFSNFEFSFKNTKKNFKRLKEIFCYFLFSCYCYCRKWEKWNNARFLTQLSIFPFFAKNRKTENEKNHIYSHLSFIFSILFKKWKNRKIAYLSPNFP